tara:strand:- start:861 stop:1151 length:291 start_codon:yes stop_codon:yes gene_type:complete
MKTTNQIEKALKDKIEIEIAAVVDVFIKELDTLQLTYGGSNYYTIISKTNGEKEKKITLLEKYNLRRLLQEMIRENHEEVMLLKKTKQLLAKLEIL